jgi:hypothetical protein
MAKPCGLVVGARGDFLTRFFVVVLPPSPRPSSQYVTVALILSSFLAYSPNP